LQGKEVPRVVVEQIISIGTVFLPPFGFLMGYRRIHQDHFIFTGVYKCFYSHFLDFDRNIALG
jgi:hypothetical protein